jgi:hypothetical protein
LIDNQLTSIAFLLTILLLTVHEKNRLNTLVTPFTVTAWPFVVIAILVNYFLIYLGYKPVTMRVQLFILLNLIILWVVGYLIDIFIIPKGSIISIKKNDEVFKELHRYEWLIIVLSWFAIAIIIRRVFSLFNKYGGFVFIGDSRFENMMVQDQLRIWEKLLKYVLFYWEYFSIFKAKDNSFHDFIWIIY